MVDEKEIVDISFMFCDQVASKLTWIFLDNYIQLNGSYCYLFYLYVYLFVLYLFNYWCLMLLELFAEITSDVIWWILVRCDCTKEEVIREGEGETYCAFQSSKAGFVYFFLIDFIVSYIFSSKW